MSWYRHPPPEDEAAAPNDARRSRRPFRSASRSALSWTPDAAENAQNANEALSTHQKTHYPAVFIRSKHSSEHTRQLPTKKPSQHPTRGAQGKALAHGAPCTILARTYRPRGQSRYGNYVGTLCYLQKHGVCSNLQLMCKDCPWWWLQQAARNLQKKTGVISSRIGFHGRSGRCRCLGHGIIMRPRVGVKTCNRSYKIRASKIIVTDHTNTSI